MMRKLLFILLACTCVLSSFAQERASFHEVIKPIPAPSGHMHPDSVAAIPGDDVLCRISPGGSYYLRYEGGMIFHKDSKVYVALKRQSMYWAVFKLPIEYSEYYSDWELLEVELEGEGRHELLISAYGEHFRSFLHTNLRDEVNHYYLLNPEHEYVFDLGETIWEEYDSSKGHPEEETEDGSGDYITESRYDFKVRVMEGKVVFENIDCTHCESLDSVFAIEYDLKRDTLYKGRLQPQFRNLSEPFGYKVLRGKIGPYPVTMHLTKDGRYYFGYYYYDKHSKAIGLSDASFYDTSHAPVVFTETGSHNNVFRGVIKDNTFSGKWTDGKKVLDFSLHEDYSDGAVPLKVYSYHDSVKDEQDNRYDVSCMWYVIDTPGAKNNKAHFYNFRERRIDNSIEELFRDEEGAKFYSADSWTEEYNRNGLLSLSYHMEEFTGGMRIGHEWSNVIYDVTNKKTLSTYDILSCSDSVLRSVLEEVYLETVKDTLSKHLVMAERFYTGEMNLTPGGFSFFIDQYPFTELIPVPYKRLEAYIRPEYKDRLLHH